MKSNTAPPDAKPILSSGGRFTVKASAVLMPPVWIRNYGTHTWRSGK